MSKSNTLTIACVPFYCEINSSNECTLHNMYRQSPQYPFLS